MIKKVNRILVIIFMCFLLVGCKEKVYTEKPEGIVLSFLDEIEVHSDVTLENFITDTNVEVMDVNQVLETDALGNFEIEVFYTHENKKYVINTSYKVVDTTKPKIYAASSKTILLNKEEDLCSYIMYGDNHDKNPICEIEGNYSINDVGNYQITYKITDKSGNYATHNFKLNVVKAFSNSSTSTSKVTLPFDEVIERYKDLDVEYGIDVSKWQGNVDFEKVKAAGATFVMMRIGIQVSVGSEISIDEYYLQNIENAKKAGLKVGVYLYTKATTVNETKEQVDWILKTLNGIDLELPIVFDWEIWSSWNDLPLSFYDINAIADTFIKHVNDNGYVGMLYSSKNKLETIWENKNNYPVWLAHYTANTSYEGEYDMWQLSSVGRIDGISGDVDINLLFNK